MKIHLWRLTIIYALAACLLPTGCASTQTASITQPEELVWPDPPELPRIRYVRSIQYTEDVRQKTSWLGNVVRGIFGRSREKLLKPYGVVTDSSGRMYVADTAKSLVYRFDLDRGNVDRYSVIEPCGGADSRRTGFSLSRAFSRPPRATLLSPIGVSVDTLDNVYVADSLRRRVYVFDTGGKCLRVIGTDEELVRPSGIAVSKGLERLYVTDTARHTIVVYDLEGNHLFEFGRRGKEPGEFNFPTNIFVDAEDQVYVTDSLNFRVEVFTSEGEVLFSFGQLGNVSGTFNKPKGIAVDSDGHIYVVDSLFDTVQIFDDEGRLLLTFGESGQGRGEFWLPSGIFIDDHDRIYVSDSYNTRVQVFQYIRQVGAGSSSVL